MKLIKYPNPILNEISKEVTKDDLASVIESIVGMTKVLKDTNGVGLAAVQVGILKTYCLLDMTKDLWKDPSLPNVLLVINPIVREERDPVMVSEGCLSLPRFHEKFERPSEVVFSYKDEKFEDRELTLKGLLAQCLIHEKEHMLGILQINKVSLMKKDMWEKSARKRGLLDD